MFSPEQYSSAVCDLSYLAGRIRVDRMAKIMEIGEKWQFAYTDFRYHLPKEEIMTRFELAVRTLASLRKTRMLLSTELSPQDKLKAMQLIHELPFNIFDNLISSDPAIEPDALVELERITDGLPLGSKNNSLNVIEYDLPDYLAWRQCDLDTLIRGVLRINNLELRKLDFTKRTLVVTALASGALMMPFMIEALRQKGMEVEMQVYVPKLIAKQIYEVDSPEPLTGIEQVWLLDDTVATDLTVRAIVPEVKRRYGAQMPVVSAVT